MSVSPRAHAPVLVLGAGLTGMSAAWHLAAAGVERRIVERLPRPGGHVVTVEEDGFRFDRTGHLLHLRDAEMRALALRWIGDDRLEIRRRSVIWSHGVYTRYPFQANTFGLPPAVAYECLMGFLEAHFAREKPDPRNFEEFCRLHFGEGISRHFMLPYNARLWGVGPSEITAAWCSRFVPLPRLEDVVAGAVGLTDRDLGYNVTFLYPRLGIGALSDGLAREVPGIETGRAPRAIDWRRREALFDDETLGYGALVSTAPLPVLCSLLVDPPEEVARAVARLRCNHLFYLDAAVDAPCPKDFHWVYVPEEKYPFYRVGCYSNFSRSLAPPGGSSLYIELADRRAPDLAAVLPRVLDALAEMGMIRAPRDLRFARLRRIDWAYVVFDHEYFGALDTILPFLSEQRILSVGRYGGWNYSSMEDALLYGRDAARRASELVR